MAKVLIRTFGFIDTHRTKLNHERSQHAGDSCVTLDKKPADSPFAPYTYTVTCTVCTNEPEKE